MSQTLSIDAVNHPDEHKPLKSSQLPGAKGVMTGKSRRRSLCLARELVTAALLTMCRLQLSD
jgi:hypothetical protein